MMRNKAVSLFLLCLVLPSFSGAVDKDPAALAALAQMAAATGWSATSPPADAVAVGTASRASNQATVGVTLKVRGYSQLRTDIQETATTTIVNGDQGAVINPTGTQFLPIQSVLSMRAMALPMFSDITLAATDPSVAVSYLGMDTVNGQGAQKVQIARQFDPDSPLAPALAIALPITLWIDASSGLPLQIQYAQIAADNPTAFLTRVRQFSNYQTVDGWAVPFTQQDLVNDQIISTLQLAKVDFNVGLSDSDFALPDGQKGGF